MKQVCCIPYSKPFFHILHPTKTRQFCFDVFSNISIWFWCDSRKLMRGPFLKIKLVLNNPFHCHICQSFGNSTCTTKHVVGSQYQLQITYMYRDRNIDIKKMMQIQSEESTYCNIRTKGDVQNIGRKSFLLVKGFCMNITCHTCILHACTMTCNYLHLYFILTIE